MRRRWSPIFCLFEKLSNCTYSRYFHNFGRRIYFIHHNNCMCNLSWNNLENTTDNACRSIFHMMTKIHSRRTIGKYGVIWCLFKAGTKVSIQTNMTEGFIVQIKKKYLWLYINSWKKNTSSIRAKCFGGQGPPNK